MHKDPRSHIAECPDLLQTITSFRNWCEGGWRGMGTVVCTINDPYEVRSTQPPLVHVIQNAACIAPPIRDAINFFLSPCSRVFPSKGRLFRVIAGCSMSTGYFGVKSNSVAMHVMEIADTVTTCLYVWGLGFQMRQSWGYERWGLLFGEMASLAFSFFYVIVVHLHGCDCACSRLWSCKVWACCGLQLLVFPTAFYFALEPFVTRWCDAEYWWPITLAMWEVSVLAFLLCRSCRNRQELGKPDGAIDNFSTVQRRSAATEIPIWGAFIICRMEPGAIQEMEDFKTRVLRTGLRLTEDVPQVIMSIIDLYFFRGTWFAALNLLTSFAQILVGLIPRIVYGLIPWIVATIVEKTDDVAGAAKISARDGGGV